MTHQDIRNTTVALTAILSITTVSAKDAEHPNVIIFLTDDQGWGDFSSSGNPIVETPVLDSLRRNGAYLNRFYVSPLSAPTRGSLLTGKYHPSIGVVGVTGGWENMNQDEITIAQLFKACGYKTGIFGKWHNGPHYPQTPNGKGFDEFVGFCAGHISNYFFSPLQRNGEFFQTEDEYITDYITDRAIEFVERNKNNKFLMYVPYNAPHAPLQIPDKYYDKYLPKIQSMAKQYNLVAEDLAAVYGMCENIDDNIGRIIDKLHESDIINNTIIFFCTDNGPVTKRYNGGMRGIKGGVHEGGVRTVGIFYWKGHIRPATYDDLTAHIDVLPTLCDICGIDMSPIKGIDGISLKELLFSEKTKLPERTIYTHIKGLFVENNGAVRTPTHRFMIDGTPAKRLLFDMTNDFSETNNLVHANPQLADELERDYKTWWKRVWAGTDSIRYIPVGYKEAPQARLYAYEGRLTGHLKFAHKGHNGDWIENFSTAEDHIRWDIDAHVTGRYEIGIWYATSDSGAGVRLRINFEDRTVKGTIEKPFEMKQFVAKSVHTKRHLKCNPTFAYQKLGSIQLDKGKHRVFLSPEYLPDECGLRLYSLDLTLL